MAMENCVNKIKKDIELTKGAPHTVYIMLTPRPSDGDVEAIVRAVENEAKKTLKWWPAKGWFSYEPDRS